MCFHSTCAHFFKNKLMHPTGNWGQERGWVELYYSVSSPGISIQCCIPHCLLRAAQSLCVPRPLVPHLQVRPWWSVSDVWFIIWRQAIWLQMLSMSSSDRMNNSWWAWDWIIFGYLMLIILKPDGYDSPQPWVAFFKGEEHETQGFILKKRQEKKKQH